MLTGRFIEHITYEKRYSAHTVAAYRTAPEQATDRAIRAWMMHLMEGGVGPRSVNRKLSALRAFFRFARATGAVQKDPTALIDPPKTPKRLPEFVEEQRVQRLFDDLAWPTGFRGQVHRLVMELLYGTGMRLAELLGLTVRDTDLAAQTLRVLGKRNKERLIPIGPALSARICTYLDARTVLFGAPDGDAPLLVGPTGGQLTRRSVQRLVTHYLSGVTSQKKRSPHVLRHTFATHMLEHGADLNAVKEILGHANLAATQVYTHNTVEKLRKVHAQAHPRGGGDGGAA
jgi:integrase/recombinase XerC